LLFSVFPITIGPSKKGLTYNTPHSAFLALPEEKVIPPAVVGSNNIFFVLFPLRYFTLIEDQIFPHILFPCPLVSPDYNRLDGRNQR